MKFCARISGWILLLAVLTLSSGCRYLSNRYYDLRDIGAAGIGVTGENPVTGIVPPSLGAYIEITDWLHLGAIHYNGYTAEHDMRGTFVGPESETRFGLLWWQMIRKNQDYQNACVMNKFKDQDFPWCHRMESLGMRHDGVPAKRLHYEHYQSYLIRGTGLLHRGWQYWEYAGFEFAICEPFVTHAGLMLRGGFDMSEVADFVLGIVGVDFKHDDMNRDEYWMFLNNPYWMGQKLVPATKPVPLPPAAEGIKAEKGKVEGEIKVVPVPAPVPAPAPEAVPAPRVVPIPAPVPAPAK
jgi:hypothetical protein